MNTLHSQGYVKPASQSANPFVAPAQTLQISSPAMVLTQARQGVNTAYTPIPILGYFSGTDGTKCLYKFGASSLSDYEKLQSESSYSLSRQKE